MLKIEETVDGRFEATLDGIGKVGVQIAAGVEDRSVTVIFTRDEWALEVALPAKDAINFAQRLLDAALPIGADVATAKRAFDAMVRP